MATARTYGYRENADSAERRQSRTFSFSRLRHSFMKEPIQQNFLYQESFSTCPHLIVTVRFVIIALIRSSVPSQAIPVMRISITAHGYRKWKHSSKEYILVAVSPQRIARICDAYALGTHSTRTPVHGYFHEPEECCPIRTSFQRIIACYARISSGTMVTVLDHMVCFLIKL